MRHGPPGEIYLHDKKKFRSMVSPLGKVFIYLTAFYPFISAILIQFTDFT